MNLLYGNPNFVLYIVKTIQHYFTADSVKPDQNDPECRVYIAATQKILCKII